MVGKVLLASVAPKQLVLPQYVVAMLLETILYYLRALANASRLVIKHQVGQLLRKGHYALRVSCKHIKPSITRAETTMMVRSVAALVASSTSVMSMTT